MTLRDRCRGRWPDILSGLGVPASVFDGRHHGCPQCGGKDRFRYLRDDEGGFFCSTERGNGIELVMHLFGEDFRAAALRIETVIGRDDAPLPARKSPTYAERLRSVAKPSKRSAYLASRGLEVAPGLLFATGVEYRDDGKLVGTYPAMLAPVTRDGKWLTFHATYLERGKKADVPCPRKVLPGSPISGAGIALYPAAEVMGVAEGIETAIAAKMLFGVPTHSAINASMLAKWQWPKIARKVHVYADADANFAGIAAGWQLAHRLALKGVEVEVHLPDELGDFNDVLLRHRVAA